MNKSYSIGFVIGASLEGGFNKILGGARTKLGMLGNEIKSLSRQQGLIERVEKDEAALGKARIAYKAASAEVARLKLALTKNPESKGLAKDLEVARTKAEKLSASIEKHKNKLRGSQTELSKAGLSVKNLGGDYERLGKTLDATRLKHDRLEKVMARKSAAGKRLAELRGDMLALAGLAYGASRLIGQATAFEDAGVRLSTVANVGGGNLGESLAASRAHALDFTRRNLATESDVLDIEYALNSSGMDAATSRIGSEIVSKVAKITNGAAEGVGEVMATVFNNLGAGLKGNAGQRLERIGELLTKTQFKFQIRNFDQLGESMKYATPDLAKYNVELSQGVTLVGALNSAGLQGSMAGTALSASFRQMSRAADEFGFEMARDAKGGLDFIRTMENLSDAIGGFEDMDQKTMDALSKTFGSEGERAIVLLGKRLGELRDAQRDVAEGSKGLVDESYQRFLNSTSGRIQIFSNNARVLGTVFAGTLMPALNAVLAPLVKLAGWAGIMIEQYPVIGQLIGGVVVGLGAYVTAMAAVTAATWLWNAANLANPVGLIITAVVAGAALVIKYWEPISGFFIRLWEGIKKAFEIGVATITRIWESSPMGILFKAGKKGWGQLSGFVGDLFGGSDNKAAAPLAARIPEARADVANTQNFNVAPTINVAAGADYGQVRAAVDAGMGDSERRFKDMMDRYMLNQRRLAYE
jgi:TP901 family phage tail tape measure protein